jgi:two-component system phosphate regulon sensor histidine kinase PhoR
VTERLQAHERRREFVANASHELRTPAASILAMTETLIAGGKDDPARLDRTLHSLLTESQRLSRLIADLLDLARAERAGVSQRVPVPVAEIVAQALNRVSGTAREHGLTLAAEIQPELTVLSDPHRLEQVLLNLLENAVNYTPEGGRVRVAAAVAGPQVVVTVADTGLGIAPEHLPRIFERFYRVDKGRSRETGGTGLGLAIVKHLVAADAGEVSAESTVGVGTTFTIRYPRTDGAAGDDQGS